MESDRVAFFDFCETLVDFQTADAFVDYVREKTNKSRMKWLNYLQFFLLKTQLIKVASALFPEKSINKRVKLYQLRGFTKGELNKLASDYYIERIRPHFVHKILNELITLKKEGYLVGLVSGGYGIYLKYFVEEFDLDFCISSNVGFKMGKCTGYMDGPDCLNRNKIILLKKYFIRPPLESIAFSDSSSDMPLLKYVKKGVVVSRQHQDWSSNFYKEIIW